MIQDRLSGLDDVKSEQFFNKPSGTGSSPFCY